MCPKGCPLGELLQSCQYAVVSYPTCTAAQYLAGVGEVLGSDRWGIWDPLSTKIEIGCRSGRNLLILGELEWRGSAAGSDGEKLGREGEKKKWGIVAQRDPRTDDDQLTQFTAPFQSPSSTGGYSDIPVSALLVWVSVWVSTWWSFCFEDNLGKS